MAIATKPKTSKEEHHEQSQQRASIAQQRRLWKAAIKVPMYTVAVIPIFVGSAASFSTTGQFHVFPFILFLLSAISLIAWENITNDAFDFAKGIDSNKPESVVNLLGGTRHARNLTLIIGFTFLLPPTLFIYLLSTSPSSQPNDFTILLIIAFTAFLGYIYQGPPFRLGYYGLGELIAFTAWFLGTIAAYHSQHRLSQPISPSSLSSTNFHTLFIKTLFSTSNPLLPSTFLVSLLTSIILFCSHFHQEKDDRAAGKLSPIVRLGVQRASLVLRNSVITLYAVEVIAWMCGWLPSIVVLTTFTTIPLAKDLVVFVTDNFDMPSKVRPAKYYAVKLHFWFGVSLAVGLFASYFLERRSSF